MVVAAAHNGVIGIADGLPWRIAGDLARFKQLTVGGVVIMGRATYQSIGRPLPGRTNVVLTRSADFVAEGVAVVHSVDEAVGVASDAGVQPVSVIGGAEIYRQLLDFVTKIELTVVDLEPEGDTWLDPLDPTEWSCGVHAPGGGDPPHVFHTIDRIAGGSRLSCLPAALVEQSSS